MTGSSVSMDRMVRMWFVEVRMVESLGLGVVMSSSWTWIAELCKEKHVIWLAF
jgi:hypothetical protein